jgi:hypothetical protein
VVNLHPRVAERAAMVYELWDTESANIIDTFATEEEALHVVRETMATYGRHSVRAWALGSDENDDPASVIYGDALADRASSSAVL